VSPRPSLTILMVALLATHFAGMGAFLTVPVLAPAIAAETGLAASLAGLHTALAYAGALLSGPFTGPLVQRHGGVRVLQCGLVVIGCGIALAAVGTPWAFAASAFLAGLGHGPVTPGSSHLIAARTPPHRRALVFSMKQAGVPAGAMLIAAAAPVIALLAGSWRISVLAIATIAFVVAAALQPLRAALDAGRNPGLGGAGVGAIAREAVGSVGMLRTDAVLRRLTIMSCGYGVAQFCFLTFFVAFQVGALGRTLAEAGLILAFAQVAGITGRLAWALIADRIGGRWPLLACGLGAAAGGLVLAFAGPATPGALVILAGIVMGATAVGWNGVMLAEAARIAPQGQVGAATAALSFAFAITMMIAPPAFTGLVALTGGYTAGFLMCVAAALVGAWAIGTGPRR